MKNIKEKAFRWVVKRSRKTRALGISYIATHFWDGDDWCYSVVNAEKLDYPQAEFIADSFRSDEKNTKVTYSVNMVKV